MTTMTSADAQNHFGELLDRAQREPIGITRRGRIAAYMVSSETYRALKEQAEVAGGSVAAYFDAIAAFRGKGSGGTSTRLIADRRADDDTLP